MSNNGKHNGYTVDGLLQGHPQWKRQVIEEAFDGAVKLTGTYDRAWHKMEKMLTELEGAEVSPKRFTADDLIIMLSAQLKGRPYKVPGVPPLPAKEEYQPRHTFMTANTPFAAFDSNGYDIMDDGSWVDSLGDEGKPKGRNR